MQWIGEDALWQKLSPAAIDTTIGDLRVRIVSYEDLVDLKMQANRGQDIEDLKKLREARAEE